MQTNRSSKSGTTTKTTMKLVPVMIGGTQCRVPLSDLAKGTDVHHGTASCGTKVNSPRTKYVGESVAIFPSDKDDRTAITMTQAGLELVAISHLTRRGFAITPPTKA